MIEVTFRIESTDYTDKLDPSSLLVLEALSQSGNINPVLKLACNTPPEASSRRHGHPAHHVVGPEAGLATKIVNANREAHAKSSMSSTPPAKASTCTSATAPPRSAEGTEWRRPGVLPSARIDPRADSNQIAFEAGPSPPRAPPAALSFCLNRIISAKRTPPNHGRRFHLPRLYFTIPRVYKSATFCLRISCAIRKGGTAMILALAGNPNCGKTTLFQRFTGLTRARATSRA